MTFRSGLLRDKIEVLAILATVPLLHWSNLREISDFLTKWAIRNRPYKNVYIKSNPNKKEKK